jgi:amino acid transporter
LPRQRPASLAGSAYTYECAVLGELVAGIIGWGLLLEYALDVAVVSIGWSGYLQALLRNPPSAKRRVVALFDLRIEGVHVDVDDLAHWHAVHIRPGTERERRCVRPAGGRA